MSIISERMRITTKARRLNFEAKLVKHAREVEAYWILEKSLGICEDDDVLDMLIDIDSRLTTTFLLEAKIVCGY